MREAGCERRVLNHCGHKTAETREWTLTSPWPGKEGSIEWPHLPGWLAQY